MTDKELLIQARAIVAQRYAWVKRTFYKFRTVNAEIIGCYCMLGAINAAHEKATGEYTGDYVRTRPETLGARRLLARVIGGKGSRSKLPGDVIARFNDAADTEKKDVLAAFDRAIELA